jgi:hypothetical protein
MEHAAHMRLGRPVIPDGLYLGLKLFGCILADA